MVRFDRNIPPGGEGLISLKINLKDMDPGAVQRSARIYTNDPINSTALLTVKAFVKAPIHVSPKKVNLIGDEGSIITESVTITANEEIPLELEPQNLYFTEMVTYQLEVIEQGKIFKINFTNLPNAQGSFKGVLILKTNYPEKPEIYISIAGDFQNKTR